MQIIQELFLFFKSRRLNYLQTFDNEAGRAVLQDLAKFCRANETTFHPDPRVHAMLEGRREVWLRLQDHLQLSDDELYRLYAKKNPQ